MTGLDYWLKQATFNLAAASAAQVRREIQEHYELAREAAIAGRATAEFAAASALKALGAAKTANRQYRRVLLTSGEARSLRGGEFEARAVCSRPWLRWMLPALPLAGLAVAAALFFTGHVSAARDALIIAIGMSPALTGPILPIYTPIRSRVFRVVKWSGITGALLIVVPVDVRSSWLLFSSLWIIVWTERTRASIRRKLPVAAWPKQLYL